MTAPERLWIAVTPSGRFTLPLRFAPLPADAAVYARHGAIVIEYAPVRRCDQCAHWDRDVDAGGDSCGWCDAFIGGGMATASEESCSRWEESARPVHD